MTSYGRQAISAADSFGGLSPLNGFTTAISVSGMFLFVFVYSESLIAGGKKVYYLTSCGYTCIDVGLFCLGTHFLGREEESACKFFKIHRCMVRREIRQISNV